MDKIDVDKICQKRINERHHECEQLRLDHEELREKYDLLVEKHNALVDAHFALAESTIKDLERRIAEKS